MYPYLNNELTDSSLTDNIISRHFNQSLSNELFNFNYQLNTNEKLKNDDNFINEYPSIDLTPNNKLNSQNELNQNSQLNNNQNYEINQTQIDENEILSNRNDKIRDLIKDCELINNNNINNFVNNYLDNQSQTSENSIKLVTEDKCKCKCHCSGHKKKNPFHLIKSNKFINTLSKIKSHKSGCDRKLDNNHKSSKNLDDNNYNTFTSSLSNYSLSSSSSISSQTISVSSCSSVQDNNYNLLNTNTIQLTKPTRKPPPLPLNQTTIKPAAKLPAIPPADLDECKKEEEKNLNKERCKIDYEDMRILTKSFEDLLNLKTDFNLKELKEESIYETIDSDYEVLDDEKKELENKKNELQLKEEEEEEDLYEDIENFDEDDVYESLSNELNNSLDHLNLPIKQNNYANCETDLDRKLVKQQKILDKKRQLQAQKLRKKFGITGKEIPLNVGVVKKDVKGNSTNLTVNKDEIVLIIRINGCIPGKWLAKNELGKYGYIDLNLVDVDTENLKCLYNEPNLLTN